jgi:phosphatidylinositol-3-phosphatase
MQRNLITLSLAVTALALVACVPQNTATPIVSISPAAPSPTSAPATRTPTTIAPTATASPIFSRVYVIVMENKDYGDIVGSANAPYINSLIAQYGLATNYTAVAHPSEPNYLALFSGSTQGATGDGVYNLDGANLADQLEAKDKTWRVFAENVPPNCFSGEVGINGEDGIGFYARKHNPAISFTDISGAPLRCANITDFTHFDPAAADYALIVPNLCNDMHDCSVAAGDNFLKGLVPKILNSSAWKDGGVLFITWDEGTTNAGGGGRVPLLIISSRVPKGFQSATAHDHYSLVRTIEDAWGLGCLNESCKANTLDEFFQR